jgi:hypothetical protein
MKPRPSAGCMINQGATSSASETASAEMKVGPEPKPSFVIAT